MNQPIQLRSDALSRTVSLVRGIEKGKMSRLTMTSVNQHSSMTVSSNNDMIATKEYILKLSQNCTDAGTKLLMEHIQREAEDTFLNSIGLGETNPIFQNDKLEMRFYNS